MECRPMLKQTSSLDTANVGVTKSKMDPRGTSISRFDMTCSQAHWARSKPIFRVMQLKLHEPTLAIGYLLCMCARHVNSTNPGRINLVFRSKPIAEAEMSNRLIR